jgi:hypothetical protein
MKEYHRWLLEATAKAYNVRIPHLNAFSIPLPQRSVISAKQTVNTSLRAAIYYVNVNSKKLRVEATSQRKREAASTGVFIMGPAWR